MDRLKTSENICEVMQNGALGLALKEMGFISWDFDQDSVVFEGNFDLKDLPKSEIPRMREQVFKLIADNGFRLVDSRIFVGEEQGASPAMITLNFRVGEKIADKLFASSEESVTEEDKSLEEIVEAVRVCAVKPLRLYDGASCFGRSRRGNGRLKGL